MNCNHVEARDACRNGDNRTRAGKEAISHNEPIAETRKLFFNEFKLFRRKDFFRQFYPLVPHFATALLVEPKADKSPDAIHREKSQH